MMCRRRIGCRKHEEVTVSRCTPESKLFEIKHAMLKLGNHPATTIIPDGGGGASASGGGGAAGGGAVAIVGAASAGGASGGGGAGGLLANGVSGASVAAAAAAALAGDIDVSGLTNQILEVRALLLICQSSFDFDLTRGDH